MSEKTLQFDNVEFNRKEFHASKQPIGIRSVNINRIIISDIFKAVSIFLAMEMMILQTFMHCVASYEWIHKIF